MLQDGIDAAKEYFVACRLQHWQHNLNNPGGLLLALCCYPCIIGCTELLCVECCKGGGCSSCHCNCNRECAECCEHCAWYLLMGFTCCLCCTIFCNKDKHRQSAPPPAPVTPDTHTNRGRASTHALARYYDTEIPVERQPLTDWSCSHCTFINSGAGSKCAICDNPRGQETSAPGSHSSQI